MVKIIVLIWFTLITLDARSEYLVPLSPLDVMIEQCKGIVLEDNFGVYCFETTEKMHEFIDEAQEIENKQFDQGDS